MNFFISELNGPNALASTSIDLSGNIYCSNANNNTISKITSSGVVSLFAPAIGSPDVLNIPTGLAFDGSGNLYCGNAGNGTVSKIDSTGNTVTFSTDVGLLSNSAGVAFDTITNILYVGIQYQTMSGPSLTDGSITQVDSSGVASTFVATGNGIVFPAGLACDSLGNVYCANISTDFSMPSGYISITSPGGSTAIKFAPNDTSFLNFPTGIGFDLLGNLFVGIRGDYSVIKITSSSPGVYSGTSTFISPGIEVNAPGGLACDFNGNVFISNQGNNSITKATQLGITSTFVQGILFPSGLVFDPSGNLYVSDNNGNCVSKITPGGVASTFAIVESNPQGLAFGSDGNLYVANTNSGSVSQINPSGVVIQYITGLPSPQGLTFGPDGFLYCSCNNGGGTNGIISQIISANTAITFVDQGLGLNNPFGLIFGVDGNLYVANNGDNTILRITSDGSVINIYATVGTNPTYLIFDQNQYLFVVNNNDSTISKISPTGTSVTTPYTGLSNPYGLAINNDNFIFYGSQNTNSIFESVSPSCFNYGTKILCIKSNKEVYIPIQDLRADDIVKTYLHGNLKIKMIGKRTMINGDKLINTMYIWRKTEENELIEDLIITGGHSVLLDKLTNDDILNQIRFRSVMKIDDKFLQLSCNNKHFERIEDENIYTYYHLVLESDSNKVFGIWANGILTETICESYFLKHRFELL
jgi:sugar lactone lactonase YvrE